MKRPEEYYGKRGEWREWDHYLLGGDRDDDNDDDGAVGDEVLKWQ